ncbi:hypothetical protein Q8A67_007528 [Cirrhinus molitorella]|uniref:Uncharacterized protein n=1 Tax=Cirrhinus molitorella TaxID=172907 RepID=A0AA88TRY8_9TELE|nr:hypothetical protein Q8A67_007528 [Cirrhinus molitorella]
MRSADQRNNNSHSVAQRKQFTPHHPARDAPGAPPPPMPDNGCTDCYITRSASPQSWPAPVHGTQQPAKDRARDVEMQQKLEAFLLLGFRADKSTLAGRHRNPLPLCCQTLGCVESNGWQSPKMLNSNKKPKGSGISYERDLIKNEDKDNVKCYTPPQQPKSTIHSGSRAEREFSYVDQE